MNSNPFYISEQERLDLKKMMLKAGDEYEDNTANIRKIKHSERILADVCKIQKVKKSYTQDHWEEEAKKEAPFLESTYSDIYHKLLKDEIDVAILGKFIKVLNMIENQELDQQEGSVIVGKILKELYVDSAVKHADHLDEQYSKPTPHTGKSISWKEWAKR